MKILNKINSFVAIAGLSLVALSACNKDDIDYSQGTYPNAPDVYFAVQDTVAYNVGTDDKEYTFFVYRVSPDVQNSVALDWSGDTDIFDLPSTVAFEDGEVRAEVSIGLSAADMTPLQPYNLTVKIPGTESTPYTQNYKDLRLTYLPMTDWEPFRYDEALGRTGFGYYSFSHYFSGTYPCYVESRHGLLDEDLMEYNFYLVDDETGEHEFMFTATTSDGGQNITIPVQVFNDDPDWGLVYICDLRTYTGNSTWGPSYFDEETGTFYLDDIYWDAEGLWNYGYESCTLNGYLDTNDYSVNLTDLGQTTVGNENYEIVGINWGACAFVKYTVVTTASLTEDGDISDTLLANLAFEIDKDEVESTTINKSGNYSLKFETSGNYTLVAVGYKQELDGSFSQQSVQYVSFSYTSADPDAGWVDRGYVEYTDTYMSNAFGFEAPTYYVPIQEFVNEPGYYRLVDPYGEWYPYNEPGDWNGDVTSYLYVNASNHGCVYIPESPQTIDWGYGTLTCYSLADYYFQQGATEADVISEGVNGTLADGKITFPELSLLFALGEDGWYQTNEEGFTDSGEYYETGMFLLDLNTLTDNLPAVEMANAKAKAKAAKIRKALKAKGGKALKAKKKGLKKHVSAVRFSSKALNGGTFHGRTVMPFRVRNNRLPFPVKK